MTNTYSILVESGNDEVIKGMRKFAKQVTAQGMGMVTGAYQNLGKGKLRIDMAYNSLGFFVFKRVVFSQIKKTVLGKDENARVEILGEKKKAGLVERLFKSSKSKSAD